MMQSDVTPLSSHFFSQPTVAVARQLLGHLLVIPSLAGGGSEGFFRIVETEAYTQDDPACHAYGKTTGRGSTLYKAPGLSYVYLIYGIHHCLNVVTEPEGQGGAVLFRALEPLGRSLQTHGPGRLCKALNITRQAHNEMDLTSALSPLYLAQGESVADAEVTTTTRIGISKAKTYPWRFYITGNPWVSVP